MLITPPCQGMSFAGKRDLSDSRNMLFKYGRDCILDLQPEYAIIENVPTFFNIPIEYNDDIITIIDYIKIKLNTYTITYDIVDCADYGIPQHRKRAIILISKHTIPKFSNKEKKQITVRQAIEKLPILESGEKSNIKYHNAKKHNSRHIEFMKHTPTGKTALFNKVYYPKKEDGTRIKGYSTTYKRIEWDKPAPTITMANGSVSSQNNVHPGRLLENGTYSDARVLTLKEIMILSSIPDTWDLPQWASENLIRKVIGEGIPLLLIKKLSKKLTEQYVT